jgi:lambda family phage portal protein
MMLEKTRRWLASKIAPRGGQLKRIITLFRAYHAAGGGRLTAGWTSSNSSADAELIGGLQKLRGRSRSLIRDSAYAKRAKLIVVNNVIGPGIGLQSQVKFPRGKLDAAVNEAIETEWGHWSRGAHCHTGGSLDFSSFERVSIGQVFEAGEVIIRKHRVAMPGSRVPLALELIEAERLAEHFTIGRAQTGNEVRMGIEIDQFQRPVAYWFHQRHPGDTMIGANVPDQLVRVPADQIMHLYVINRWPQTRGEPWLHAVARRLNDMDGYAEAEIVAARGAANYMAFMKTPDNNQLPPDLQEGDQREINYEPGLIEQLPPGYDIVMNNPNRPNPNMDPFMRLMLREVASGVGVSYESLSRDYSQSNYSSSRLALIDDRDLWRTLQQWFIQSFRAELHRVWLEAAVLAGAIKGIALADYLSNRERYEAVRFKPRGWSWVDPTKEVQAYKDAVRCGFTTVSDVIAQTGGGQDIEDVLEQRKRELEMMEELDLHFDTDPDADAETAPEMAPESEPESEGESEQDDAIEPNAPIYLLKATS